mmetsp:Transcript_55849/g.147643  ORF Transcript_55849/g.147643 Transcript_55849/m.147643 type:complete len:110 (+) Transcript_55849:736-1065(+)
MDAGTNRNLSAAGHDSERLQTQIKVNEKAQHIAKCAEILTQAVCMQTSLCTARDTIGSTILIKPCIRRGGLQQPATRLGEDHHSSLFGSIPTSCHTTPQPAPSAGRART